MTTPLLDLQMLFAPIESANEALSYALVATGLSARYGIQAHSHGTYTVANRLRTIYPKLYVSNRTQAALYALRHGWATLDEPPK